VPVQRATVEVHTRRGLHVAVLFLRPDCDPQDLFEDDAPFFPADEAGTIRLFARASVVDIVVDASDEAPESLAALGVPYVVRNVAVHLEHGATIVGSIRSPGNPTRTLDLVNERRRSFAVYAGGKVHHVAKAHVEPIEEMP
jgi:hypothetical protein